MRFGRPFGFLARKFFSRDHKKLLLFDDQVAYLGGINFSEHNFDWHDMMLRIEHPEVTEFLRQDFQHSWDGRSTESSRSFADLDMDLHLLSGEGNRRAFGRVLRLIDDAERSIVVISPYLGPPFTEHMAAAVKRGVEVRIVTPDNNNKSYLKQYVLAEAARAGFEVWLLQERMIHMKCMLIDDRGAHHRVLELRPDELQQLPRGGRCDLPQSGGYRRVPATGAGAGSRGVETVRRSGRRTRLRIAHDPDPRGLGARQDPEPRVAFDKPDRTSGEEFPQRERSSCHTVTDRS